MSRSVICKAFARDAKGSMGKRGASEPPKQPAGRRTPTTRREPAERPFPMHEHIGRQLKAMFDEVTAQPVPEKLASCSRSWSASNPK